MNHENKYFNVINYQLTFINSKIKKKCIKIYRFIISLNFKIYRNLYPNTKIFRLIYEESCIF